MQQHIFLYGCCIAYLYENLLFQILRGNCRSSSFNNIAEKEELLSNGRRIAQAFWTDKELLCCLNGRSTVEGVYFCGPRGRCSCTTHSIRDQRLEGGFAAIVFLQSFLFFAPMRTGLTCKEVLMLLLTLSICMGFLSSFGLISIPKKGQSMHPSPISWGTEATVRL